MMKGLSSRSELTRQAGPGPADYPLARLCEALLATRDAQWATGAALTENYIQSERGTLGGEVGDFLYLNGLALSAGP
jgi:hypothetical protein